MSGLNRGYDRYMSAPLGQGVSNSGGYGRVEVIGEDEDGVDGGGGGGVDGEAVQVDSVKTRVESAYGFST